jgi:hypothetical protein
MKKNALGANRKLILHRETLRVLDGRELKPIAAGDDDVTPATSRMTCPPPEFTRPPLTLTQ